MKLDGANGIGAKKVVKLLEYMQGSAASLWLDVQVYNDGSAGELNKDVRYYNSACVTCSDSMFQCGADYVKSQQRAPSGLKFGIGERCASFDGDGDRIVYFYKEQGLLLQLCYAIHRLGLIVA